MAKRYVEVNENDKFEINGKTMTFGKAFILADILKADEGVREKVAKGILDYMVKREIETTGRTDEPPTWDNKEVYMFTDAIINLIAKED